MEGLADTARAIERVRDKIRSVELGAPVHSGPFTAVPLLQLGVGSDEASATALPLSQALQASLVVVSECMPPLVDTLVLENRSADRWVIGLLGETLLGGRQDRALVSAVLVAPRTCVDVRVKCVEQHRWSKPQAFAFHTEIATGTVRTIISRAPWQGRRSNMQHQVWRAVTGTTTGLGTAPGVMREALRAARPLLEPHIRALRACPDQVGVCLFHGERLVALELLAGPEQLLHYHDQLVRSALIDLLPFTCLSGNRLPPDTYRAATTDLLDSISTSTHWEPFGKADGGQQLRTAVGQRSATALVGAAGLEYLGFHAGGPVVRLATGVPTGPYELAFAREGMTMGRVKVCGDTSLIVGRSRSCQIQVPEETVSARHLRIDFSADGVAVADLNSSNGVWVEDERVVFVDVPVRGVVWLGPHVSMTWQRHEGDR